MNRHLPPPPPFTKALKGRNIDVLVSAMLGSAPTGLALNSPIQPRAALRFALGYHLAPRWGKNHVGNHTTNRHLPPPRWGNKPRWEPHGDD